LAVPYGSLSCFCCFRSDDFDCRQQSGSHCSKRAAFREFAFTSPVTVTTARSGRRVLHRTGVPRPRPETTLPAIEVNADRAPDNTRDRYLDKNSKAATKTDTPVLETPQSISTVTRRQIDDQNAQTISNALRYTA